MLNLELLRVASLASGAILAVSIILNPGTTMAQSPLTETFAENPNERWRYFADTVMGGVSRGEVEFISGDEESYARLTGNVSTDNNGGFIQIRSQLEDPLPSEVTGVRLVVRGNGAPYFVHLRTAGMWLPWQYYQGEFETEADWTEVRIPLADFQPGGTFISEKPRAERIRSIGIVAYGRDHQADVSVSEVGFY